MSALRWIALRLLWAIGYLWAWPIFVRGFGLLVIAYLVGAVEYARWEGPALLVKVKGPFAQWMATRGAKWYGHTFGACMFMYVDPEPETLRHELQHVYQQMVLGFPLHLVVYGVSWTIELVRHRDMFEAYRHCILERDARRAAGEDV